MTQIALPHFLLLLRSKHFSLNLFTQKRNFVILCADLHVVRNYFFKYPNCIKTLEYVCLFVSSTILLEDFDDTLHVKEHF